MVKLYTWTTPNGRKISIMLEELGIPYEVEFVDIGQDQQFEPGFLAVAPNNKIPAILDDEAPDGPLSIFESGAILTYLAAKHGRFLAPSGAARWKAQEWLYWQVGGLGPMLGQAAFFAVRSPEKMPVAIDRFVTEAGRLLGVLERRLAAVPYLAGDDYSIADMAAYPWVSGAMQMMREPLAAHLAEKPAIDRWVKTLGERPGVQRGMAVAPAKADSRRRLSSAPPIRVRVEEKTMPRIVKLPGPDHPITIEPSGDHVVIRAGGRVIADTRRALILQEAEYPAVRYVPREDVDMTTLSRTTHESYCPYKGDASYFSIPCGGERSANAVWTYETPHPAAERLKGHLAFYPDRVDAIEIGD